MMREREAAGENDTYGFALEAHPGKSEGAASYTNGLMRPTNHLGLLGPRSPRSPCPGTSRHPMTWARTQTVLGEHSHAGTPAWRTWPTVPSAVRTDRRWGVGS